MDLSATYRVVRQIAPSSSIMASRAVASLPPSPLPSSLYASASAQVSVPVGAGQPPASDPVSPDPARSFATRDSAVDAPQPGPLAGREVPSRETGSDVAPSSRRGAVIALREAVAAAALMVVIRGAAVGGATGWVVGDGS